MGQSTDAILGWGLIWEAEGLNLPEGVSDIEKRHGVEIGSHCSGDYPMPYIAIAESHKRAWRGDPHRFESLPDVGSDWPTRIASAYTDLLATVSDPGDWNQPGDPQWFIASMWS